MRREILLLCTVLSWGVSGAQACQKGDIPCFCRAIGGTYRYGRTPVLNSCRVYYYHQGRQRYVQLYLPPDYDGQRKFPMWVHLHGVFWNSMGGIGQQVGPIDATDIVPVWDRAVSQFGSQAILVYPQSTGNPGPTGDLKIDGDGKVYKQFWNIPFWRCSVGVCSDSSVDDVGFIDQVLQDMPRRLQVKSKQVLLTGDSAGGMMVQALLCESRVVSKVVTAAVDILGGIGKDYSQGSSCKRSPAVAFLKIQGMKDPFITFDREILVDGVNFLSSVGSAQARAARNGCADKRYWGSWTSEYGDQYKCINYCEKKPGAKAAKVCGLTYVAHDTDHPWPGFVFQQAWKFFNQQVAQTGQHGRGGASSAYRLPG